MKTTKSKFTKNVELALPPGDEGPVCTYPPDCSPSDSSRDLGVWRKAQFRMTERNIEGPTQDEERQLINTWILQLLRRELAHDLDAAEHKLKRRLEVDVGVLAAEVIQAALARRAPRPKRGKKKSK
jgi:hypothetical protein